MSNPNNNPANRKEFFNKAAPTWDKTFYNTKLADFLTELVPKFGIKTGQKVLDIGTGTGILLPYLLDSVGPNGHVTAVDFAEKMIEKCKTKYANQTNLALMVQDAENLQFPNGSFDAVTCFGLFPHLENKASALNQFNRVLKPGGKLVIAHALSSHEIEHHHRNVPAVSHDFLPGMEEMCNMLRQTGFENTAITDKPGCYLCISNKLVHKLLTK
jgi:demethylmenaquinone methyltransferase/2-methoxy-6-polyprenyl-1,4-benzoquinol methylase